jgi:MFS family permease
MPANGQATANGLVTAGALVGIAFCFPVFGWLMDRLGWPGAFIFSGVALVVYSVIWRFLAASRLPGPTPTSVHAPPDPADILPPPTAGWALMRSKDLWLLTLSYAAFGYFQYLFFYWLGYYFKEVMNLPTVESRNLTMYIMLAMGAGMAIGGLGTDLFCRLFGTIAGRRTIVMAGMCLAALFALTAVQLTRPADVVFWLALSMGALGMCEGVFWTTATDIGGRARGFAGAFMNTGGNVGGFISPVLTPMMAEHMGWPGAITVACVVSGIGGLVWFGIQPKHAA